MTSTLTYLRIAKALGLHEMNNTFIKYLDDYETCVGYKNAPFFSSHFLSYFSPDNHSHGYYILQLLDTTIPCLLLPHSLLYLRLRL